MFNCYCPNCRKEFQAEHFSKVIANRWALCKCPHCAYEQGEPMEYVEENYHECNQYWFNNKFNKTECVLHKKTYCADCQFNN